MGYRVVSVILLLSIVSVFGEQAENTTAKVDVTPQKSARNLIYAELISCAVRYDTACFVNVAQDFLEIRRNELLAQADEEALRTTGRAEPENTPSHLAKMIEKLISDLTSMFKDNFSGYFSAKENDEEAEEDEKDVDNNKTSNEVGTSRSSQGASEVSRKKKKDHPIKKLIHKILFGIVTAAVVIFLFSLFYAGLALKVFLLHAMYFFLHVLKFYFWTKQAKHEPNIHYEHAHHDYHVPSSYEEHITYDSHHDDGQDEHGHPYWGREDNAHELAYSKQKPMSLIKSMFG